MRGYKLRKHENFNIIKRSVMNPAQNYLFNHSSWLLNIN